MIILHGLGGFALLDANLEKEQQETLLFNAARILKARGYPSASHLLRRMPFEVLDATNDFNDDFCVLFALLPLDAYEEMRGLAADEEGKFAFGKIAEVITEIGPYIRFVACELAKEQPDLKWQHHHEKSFANRRIADKKLPVAVRAVVNEFLAAHTRH